MLKYKQLAAKVSHDIQQNRLKNGARMLSLRQFAKQHSISVSTAVSCYEELEKQGWIAARPQAGFYVTHSSTILPSPHWPSFNTERTTPSRPIKEASIPQGALGMACLELDEHTQRSLDRSLRKAIQFQTRHFAQYPAQQGEPYLRDALAEHFQINGYALNSNELVITHGCMDAVKTALMVCTNKGDTIAVSSPCFNGLLDLIAQLDLNLIEIPSHEDGIDLDALEKLLQDNQIQAGLFCTTHMNPQGITLSSQQKQRLANLAATYRIPVIEDDVYFELSHSNELNLPAAYYDTSGYVIWCSSISKTLSPNYRLGWCKPGKYFASFLQYYQGVSGILQYAISDLICSGHYAKHLKRAQYTLAQNKRDYSLYLATHLPMGSRITQPDGGLVLWMQIPHLDITRFKLAIQREKIDIRTGDIFTESHRYSDCLRINIGYPLDGRIEKQLDKLMALIHQCCTG